MANWPESNTARFFVDYEGDLGKRTVQFRPLGATSTATMITEIAGFLNAIKAVVHTSVSFNYLRMAVAGTNVSNPVPGWTPIVGTSAAAFTAELYPRFVSFVGRDTVGTKVRLSLYGCTVGMTTDYRITPGENATLTAVISYLNDPARQFATVANHQPVWKLYANQGYNAYHQRRRRATA